MFGYRARLGKLCVLAVFVLLTTGTAGAGVLSLWDGTGANDSTSWSALGPAEPEAEPISQGNYLRRCGTPTSSSVALAGGRGLPTHWPDWLKIAPQPPYSFFANLPTIFWFQSNPMSS